MPAVLINKPIDVATRETFVFLASHLLNGSDIIEVGCGTGEVAVELGRRGHYVTALDSEVERVTEAQSRGVRATVATWPNFKHKLVDAIAFTRSLHHIDQLDAAVDKAWTLLKTRGLLLVEDFAFGETDSRTVDWFLELLRSESFPTKGAKDHLVTKLLSADDPMAAWFDSHDKALHPIATLREAISRKFTIRETRAAPYLYRYLIPVLPETKQAAVLVERIFDEEKRAGQQKKIMLMGRRIVAVPK